MEVVFGLPGVHNLALWPALADSPIRLVGVRHEQAAAYAADGYARASGNVGVALVTTGPGAANTLGAVGEAWASRSPVVVIATDVPTTLRREGVAPRPAARGARPARDVRAGDQGDVPGGGSRSAGRARRRGPRHGDRGARAALCSSRSRRTCSPRRSRPVPRSRESALTFPRRRPATASTARLASWRRRSARSYGSAEARWPPARVRPWASWPSAWPRRFSPPTRHAVCCRPTIRVWSACRPTCPRPAPCGTRPTWCWRSAATSTG